MAIPAPGYYYRLQLKTAADLFVCIDYRGVAVTAGYNPDNADYYRWLFIPTGTNNEYWIFNKGAQNGYGQALTLPSGSNSLGQWDFNGENNQTFVLTDSGRSIKLKLKSNNQMVATRWRWDLFTWEDKDENEQRLILDQPLPIEMTDMLATYLFWNIDNKAIKDYFVSLNKIPNPQLLRINKFVFINDSGQQIMPAIHHFGCGGTPWRAGMAQCWYQAVAPNGGRTSMEVSHYLQNAGTIWLAIGSGALVVLAVVTMGAATPLATAAAAGSVAAAITEGVLVGADIAVVVFDFVELGSTINDAGSINTDGNLSLNLQASNFGVDGQVALTLQKELGTYALAIKGESFQTYTEGWYVHECITDRAFNRMYFGSGKAVFIVSDYEVEGTWRGDGKEVFELITKEGPGLLASEYSSARRSPNEESTLVIGNTFTKDQTKPNVYTNNVKGDYYFNSSDDFTFIAKDQNQETRYRRVYELAGQWQLSGGTALQTIEDTPDGLRLQPAGSTPPAWVTFQRDPGDPNIYRNKKGESCTFVSRRKYIFSNLDGSTTAAYNRLPVN